MLYTVKCMVYVYGSVYGVYGISCRCDSLLNQWKLSGKPKYDSIHVPGNFVGVQDTCNECYLWSGAPVGS